MCVVCVKKVAFPSFYCSSDDVVPLLLQQSNAGCFSLHVPDYGFNSTTALKSSIFFHLFNLIIALKIEQFPGFLTSTFLTTIFKRLILQPHLSIL